MRKTIKYLENGEYHYATVKDVGDLAKLKTDSKDDLVAAINDLFESGGSNAGKPEGYDELVNQLADTIKKQKDISGQIDTAQKELNDKIDNSNSSNKTVTDDLNKQAEEIRQKIEALKQEEANARKLLNEKVTQLTTDSQNLDKKSTDLANEIENKFSSVQSDVRTVITNLNNEATSLHKELGDVKNENELAKSQLQDQAEDIGNVHKTVDNLSDKVTQKIWMSDLDPVQQQVVQNSNEVQQTKDQLKTKADQTNLDLVANSVEKLNTEVKKNAEGLEVTVKRDELGGNISALLRDKANLLIGTRAFSGENWVNKDSYTVESGYYRGLKVLSTLDKDKGIYQPFEVKAKTTYTFSFYAKQSEDNLNAKLVIRALDNDTVIIDNSDQLIHISTVWQRFAVTFKSDSDCKIAIQITQGNATANNRIYLAGFMLQYGANDTSWEPNEADISDDIEHNESRFNVFSDKIEGVVKKQEQFGTSQNELETKVTQNAEGIKQTSHQLEDANGKINKFQGELESTAKGLKTSYEEYTNKAIGQISDSSLNLVLNGSFSNKESDFDKWQNVSAKVNIREDKNGLRWAEITQSGMTTDNPQGVTSNYFTVKQGKVTVAVDIKSGDKATLDNESVVFLEFYDENKKRVDFKWVTLSELGLSIDILNDHQVHRGLYRLAIDRNDIKYMTVKVLIIRNGDLYFTNLSARLSSIDDGAYTPNPDDFNQQILKQNTKLEQNAKELALKVNSVDVTNEIKSAKDAAIKVASDNVDIHVNELRTSFDDKLNQRINEVKTASEKFTSDGIEQTVRKITDVQNNVSQLDDKLAMLKTETTTSVKNIGDRVTTEVNSVTQKINDNNGGGVNLQVGTADFSFGIATNGNASEIISGDDNTKILHTQKGGFYIAYDAKSFVPTPGEIYTISVDIKGDGTINGSGFKYEGGNDGNLVNIKLTDQWQRISNTVHVDKVSGQWIVYPAGAHDLYFKHLKIERGNVATPWSPAPEDTTSAIKEINTKWEVANGQIAGKVTSTEVQDILNNGHYATQEWAQGQINLNKDSFNVEVKKIVGQEVSDQVKTANFGGGVNLLKGTSDFSGDWFRRDDASWVNDNWVDTNGNGVRSRSFACNGLGQTVQLEPGDYTFSLDMYLELGEKESLNIYAGDAQYNGTNGIVQFIDGCHYDHNSPQNKWFRAVAHIKVTGSGNVALRPELNQDSGTVHVGSYKLEKGSVATPWTPSPLDAVQKSNLISEFNLQAGQALIKSNRIVLDADTVDVGRIKGKDLDINLNEGSVNFEHGLIKTTDNLFGIDLDKGIVHGGRQIDDPGYVTKRRQEVVDRANDLRDKAQKKDVLSKRERNEKIGNLPFTLKGKWVTIIDDKNIVQGSNSSDSIVYRPISNNIEKDTFWGSIDNTMLSGSGKVKITMKANLANSNIGRYDSAMVFIMSAMALPNDSSINLFTLKEKGLYENTISIPKGTNCTINNLKNYGLTFITQRLGANEKLTIDELKVEVYSEALVKDLDSPEGKKIREEYEKVQREVMALGDKAQQIERDFDNNPAPIQYEGFSLDKEGLRVSADGDETVIANGKIITNNAEITGGHIDVSGAMDFNYGGYDKKFIEANLRLADGGLTFKTKDTNAGAGNKADAVIGLIATPNRMSSKPDTQLNISSRSLTFGTYKEMNNQGTSVIELHGDDGKLASGFSLNSFDGSVIHDHETPKASIYGSADGSMGIMADEIRIFGAIDMSNAPLRATGADHGIRNVWVSWSGWDGGEKYPALVNDTSNWGGIAFPKSGRVTLFDASGHYYCPDRNTGLGAYDNYMGKNGQ